MAPAPATALGIDAGGTQTRWALADGAGAIVAEGAVAGLSVNQLGSAAGVASVRAVLADLAAQVLAAGKPARVCAGLTGFSSATAAPMVVAPHSGSVTAAVGVGAAVAAAASEALAAPRTETSRSDCVTNDADTGATGDPSLPLVEQSCSDCVAIAGHSGAAGGPALPLVDASRSDCVAIAGHNGAAGGPALPLAEQSRSDRETIAGDNGVAGDPALALAEQSRSDVVTIAGSNGRAGNLASPQAEVSRSELAATATGDSLDGFVGNDHSPSWLLAEALGVAPTAVTVHSDIEIAYLASFAPGAGYLVYAGTGSIAAWIDAEGVLHRAGGRGVTLDDGGGGFWIARAAMRHIWRREDEQPGAWQQSPLAHAVFAFVGGSDWACSRQFIYGQERGAVGRLALAVAQAADADPVARAILEQAGRELARIALALVGRYGARPIAVSGRAATLHPAIMAAMRAALPAELSLTQISLPAHHAAARIALHSHA
ncbi:hypothetical protein [Duganella sp. Leaf126]|uniref:hypothetical protein n=1 Tax=Duganella sp. Leaf126 TaxID=1736266 RepID=UPI000AC2A934|nr:hypothetical protein [Duganella sp. Leaf126]